MLELLKNFIVYGVGGILSKLIVFILIPIYTSKLTPEEYGYFDLLFTVTTIAAVFGMMQMDTGFQRFYYEKDDPIYKKKLVSSTFFIINICSICTILLVLFSLNTISLKWFAGGYKGELLVVTIAILITNLYTYFLCILRFDNKPKFFALISILSAFLNALISIVLVFAFNMGVLGAVLADLIAHTTIVVLLIYIERDKLGILLNKILIKDVLKFSIPQVPARLGGVANSYINRFFMVSMFSATAIGLYSLGLKIASAIFLIQTAFTLAWKPYLYKILNKDGHKVIIRRVSTVSVVIVCSISLLLALFSRELILIVSNKTYEDACKLIGYLALYNGLFLVKETVDIGVQVTKKSQYTTYLYFMSLAVNIIGLILIPRVAGLEGVAIALLLSNVALVFSTVYVSNKLYPMKFDVILMALSILLSTILIYSLNRFDVNLYLKLFFVLVAFYVYLVYNLKYGYFKSLISLIKRK